MNGKDDMVHIYNGYYSAMKRNKTGSFVEMWMDLESIIQSVISQKKKNKYSILKHMNGIQKDSRNEAICRAGANIILIFLSLTYFT